MLTRVKNWFAGKKTILVAIAGAIGAIAAWSVDEVTTKELLVSLFVVVELIFIRLGIKKAGNKDT